MSRRREPQFDGSVANDRNEIAPHSNTSSNGCVTAIARLNVSEENYSGD